MDAYEAIMTRRSIRRYAPKQVPDRLVEDLLQAGAAAPSAGNEQPWHFVVITELKLLDEVPKFHRYAQMLKEAPLAILVCGDMTLERHEGYWVQDCAAATQNILLAAHAKGLGAVWLGIYPREHRVSGMRQLLNIPEHVTPFALISIGYPAEEKPPAQRYDTTRVHRNRW